MTLIFGITKNPNGYQAECLNFPLIIACGWTKEQLLDTILEHTQVYLDDILNENLTDYTIKNDNGLFCCYVKLQIDPKSRLLSFGQIPGNL